MKKLTRRDFLKVAAAYSAGFMLTGLQPAASNLTQNTGKQPNIILIVFDAMSARNLSVYGYPRQTTPNLERFAQRATVYHSHFSGGNFTTPGTASMLTGLYPWHHRAFNVNSPVNEKIVANNLFRIVGDQYTRVGYTQNLLADIFLRQFQENMEKHLSATAFLPKGSALMPGNHFLNDSLITYYALDTFPFTSRDVEKNLPGSLLWGHLDMMRNDNRYHPPASSGNYPNGKPFNGYYYYEHPAIFNGLQDTLENLCGGEKPVFAYFHLFSPHFPYAPRKEFVDIFPPIQPYNTARHPLSYTNESRRNVASSRDLYDSFIADLDQELGALLDALEANQILDNSYVIITSDHGELFGRGEIGHGSALLYNPVIQIPLLISSPKTKQRRDIHTPTSNTDLLPTLSLLAGQPAQYITDGQPLPGLGGEEDPARSVYSMVSKNNSAFAPLKAGTVALIKGEFKLIHYFGYENFTDQFELYSLANDPEEKRDLFASAPPEAKHMKEELLDTLASANKPYQKKQ